MWRGVCGAHVVNRVAKTLNPNSATEAFICALCLQVTCLRCFHLCVVLASDMLECSPCMYEGGADNVPKGEKETPARPAQQRSFALN